MIEIGSMFSGCGGLELGIEAAIPCAKTVWQVEQDPYALRVLEKHWPNAKRFKDARTIDFAELAPVDIICGGFPCNGISVAGKGEGLEAGQSALWWDMFKTICEVRPKFIVLENVSSLVGGGLPTILGALHLQGFNAEWDIARAYKQGAPHRRNRLFLIAYSNSKRKLQQGGIRGTGGGWPAYCGCEAESIGGSPRRAAHDAIRGGEQWAIEPAVPRMAHGVPYRMDRDRLMGNAVVPRVAYYVALRLREIIAKLEFCNNSSNLGG